MAIKIINPIEIGKSEKRRTPVFDTRKMHAWVHYYPNPGDHDDLHCHNEDQTFICLEGQCTMHFPDGGHSVLNPGMVALINGGSFYRLENSGKGPMIMMGNRSGSQEKIKIIDYETRKDVRQKYSDGKVHIHKDGVKVPSVLL